MFSPGDNLSKTLKTCSQDMREFQREKQARLNEVHVEVVLRAHQLHYVSDQQLQLSGSLEDALVIPNAILERLGSRIQVGGHSVLFRPRSV